MKTYILRAPETDRKGVDVPTLLTDLTDYVAPVVAYGTLERKAAQAIANFTVTDIAFDTTNELSGMTTDGTGLVVTTAGLYQLTFSIQWADGPIATARQGITVNGSIITSTVSTGVGADGVARATVLMRVPAAATIRVQVLQNSGAGQSVSNATLQAVRVAS